MAGSPIISVVIVSYGTRALTLDALQSVRRLSAEVPLETIVVDNASPDDSANAIAREHSWAMLVLSSTNGGFATGANLGARAARGEWLLFLNSDARLRSGALKILLDAAAELGQPGAIGPRLVSPRGPERSVGRYYGPWRDFVRAFRLYRIFPGWKCFDDVHLRRLPSKTSVVEWVSGACLLIRRDIFEKMQGFDEAYFMYVEDMDLCWRLARAGYTNLYVPEAVVDHEGGKSPRRERMVLIEGGDAPEYFIHKTGMFYPRILQRTLRGWLLTSYLGTLAFRICLQTLRGQDPHATKQSMKLCRASLGALVRGSGRIARNKPVRFES